VGAGNEMKAHHKMCFFGYPFQYLRQRNLKDVANSDDQKKCSVEVNDGSSVDKGFSGTYTWDDRFNFYLLFEAPYQLCCVVKREGGGGHGSGACLWQLCELDPNNCEVKTVVATSSNICESVKDATFAEATISLPPGVVWSEIPTDSEEFNEQRLSTNSIKLVYFGCVLCAFLLDCDHYITLSVFLTGVSGVLIAHHSQPCSKHSTTEFLN
jgi:hypothetical protein